MTRHKESFWEEVPDLSIVSPGTPKQFALVTDEQRVPKDVMVKATGQIYGHGCEGIVFPVEVGLMDGQTLELVAKRFKSETYDDMGEWMTQDPDRQAETAYKNLSRLKQLGFHTPQFVGLATDANNNRLLLMSDLSKRGKLQILDDKSLYQGREVNWQVDGKPTKKKGIEVWNTLQNQAQIALGQLETHMLMKAYGIVFHCLPGVTWGLYQTAVDPQTNTGESFVVDTGLMQGFLDNYLQTEVVTELFQGYWQRVETWLNKLIAVRQVSKSADQLLSEHFEQNPVTARLQETFYKACVGLTLDHSGVGHSAFADWCEKRFVKKIPAKYQNLTRDRLLNAKVNWYSLLMSYQDLTGLELFDISAAAAEAAANGDWNKLVDFVGLAVCDQVLVYTMEVGQYLDQAYAEIKAIGGSYGDWKQKIPELLGCIPHWQPQMEWQDDGFPSFSVFDCHRDRAPDFLEAEVDSSVRTGGLSRQMVVKVPTNDSYDFWRITHCTRDNYLITDPSQILGMRLYEMGDPFYEKGYIFVEEEMGEQFNSDLIKLWYDIDSFGDRVRIIYSYPNQVCGDEWLQQFSVSQKEFETKKDELKRNFGDRFINMSLVGS